jgi:miniconductance mechanosensitive channel
MEILSEWLVSLKVSPALEPYVLSGILGVGLLLAAMLANAIAKFLILKGVHPLVFRTRYTWDDYLVERGVFTRLSHLVPGLVIYYGALLFPFDGFANWLQRVAVAYIVFGVARSLHALLNAGQDIYKKLPFSASRPITGYVQIVQLLIWFMAAIFVVASLLNKSPAGFLTGLGALSAVLMLVFKDTILGLVAGIQITANDMVRIGDWITLPKYGADGDVIDITLHTVKIRNFDKTISTIPTHALISDSFVNWRGMSESGGRRIKRALMIDLQSVRFCDEDLLARLDQVVCLKDYLAQRRQQIEAWNREQHVDESCPINGRRLTNLGTFRAYVEAHLHQHPKIHQAGMTFLVRQLAPTEKGVPLELYVFVNDTQWVEYERVQADIFDHLFAAIPWFDLRLYQAPSGNDIRQALAESRS